MGIFAASGVRLFQWRHVGAVHNRRGGNPSLLQPNLGLAQAGHDLFPVVFRGIIPLLELERIREEKLGLGVENPEQFDFSPEFLAQHAHVREYPVAQR